MPLLIVLLPYMFLFRLVVARLAQHVNRQSRRPRRTNGFDILVTMTNPSQSPPSSICFPFHRRVAGSETTNPTPPNIRTWK
jgi:hypothetical protein